MYKNAPSLKTRIRDQLFIIDEKSLKEIFKNATIHNLQII